jgi:RNA polymerase sigma-70 factor (ECF subfamily)
MKFRDDQYYVEQVIGGNAEAFRQLVEKHQDLVYTIVHRIVVSGVEAEEVAQDVFLKAYNKLEDFRGKAKFSTWLYRIAYNTAISHGRKKKVEFLAIDEKLIENYSEEDISDNLLGMSVENQKKLITEALSTIPRTDNLIVSLFYFHKKDIDEISEIVGMTQSNVKVKLHRIRKKLLKEMNSIMDNNISTVA